MGHSRKAWSYLHRGHSILGAVLAFFLLKSLIVASLASHAALAVKLFFSFAGMATLAVKLCFSSEKQGEEHNAPAPVCTGMKLRATLLTAWLGAFAGVASAQAQLPDPDYCARRDADPEKCVIKDGPPPKPIVRKPQKPQVPLVPEPPAPENPIAKPRGKS